MFKDNGKSLLKQAQKNPSAASSFVAQAIAQGFPAIAGEIIYRVPMTGEERAACYQACIEARDITTLKSLLQEDRALSSSSSSKALVLQMAQSDWPEGFVVTVSIQKSLHYQNTIHMIDSSLSEEQLKIIFGHIGYTDSLKMLQQCVLETPDQLTRFLSLLGEDKCTPNRLAQVAEYLIYRSKETSEVINHVLDILIKHRLNVNYNSGDLMVAALSQGQIETAESLHRAGFQSEINFNIVYKKLCDLGAPQASIEYLKKIVGQSARGVVPHEDTAQGFMRDDDMSVSRVSALPAGGTLTMIFNFGLSQQILIAQSGEMIAAPTVVGFSKIENPQLLQEAATAFIELGGDAALTPFAITLKKPALLGRKGKDNVR